MQSTNNASTPVLKVFRGALIDRMTNQTDVARLNVRRNLERRLRAIIDDNDLNILDVLLKNASQRPFGRSLAVENRYYC